MADTSTLAGIKAASNPTTTTAQAPVTTDPMLVGITEAMVAAHPELEAIRDLYTKGDFAGALNALYSTDFYKNTGSTKLNNEELKRNQPGVYNDTINLTWMPTLRNYVTQAGLAVSDENLMAIAKKAFDLGLSPTAPGTLELFKPTKDAAGNAVPNPYISGISGGNAATSRQNLQTLNSDYGAGFNDGWIDTAVKSIGSGATTEQYWVDQMKSQAMGAFPGWAEQIKGGQTMKQIASPYINTYANILGVDPASITLNDTLLKQGLQGMGFQNTGAGAGKGEGQVPMRLWEFEKQVRQDPRWAQSKDAMDSLSATGSTILKQWGLMS